MAPGSKPDHRNREAAVGGTGFAHLPAVLLDAIQIHRDDLRSRAADRERDGHRIAGRISAGGNRRREIIAARQRQRHHSNTHIALLGLLPARSRIGSRGLHVDVRGTYSQVWPEVKGIASFADVLNALRVQRRRAAEQCERDRRLLARGFALLIAGAILVVIRIREPG